MLPRWLQMVAWALPPTYVFEGMRALVLEHVFRADLMVEAFALNVALFRRRRARRSWRCWQSARRHGSLLQTGE